MRTDPDLQELLTERLVLRRSLPEDAEAISTYRSDPQVQRYQGWERTDPGAILQEIQEMASRAPGEIGGWVQFSVIERDTKQLVGDVGINAADDSVMKLGYTMAPASQGLGYATEAMQALVDYAFDELGAELVRAFASEENIPSTRVAEKVGMRLMERFSGRDGDHVWHGVRYELRREDR